MELTDEARDALTIFYLRRSYKEYEFDYGLQLLQTNSFVVFYDAFLNRILSNISR